MNIKPLFEFLNEKNIDQIIELLTAHYNECLTDFKELSDFKNINKEALLYNKNLKTISIIIDGKVEGFLIFLILEHPIYNRKDIIIRDLYLSKSYRKMQISSNCVKYLINLYEEQNIFVDVLFDNEISKKFWMKNKFFPYQQRFKLKNNKN